MTQDIQNCHGDIMQRSPLTLIFTQAFGSIAITCIPLHV